MGFAFPIGLTLLSTEHRGGLVPWAYALNGGASVLGANLAIVIAMAGGFTVALSCAAVFYLGAALALHYVGARSNGA